MSAYIDKLRERLNEMEKQNQIDKEFLLFLKGWSNHEMRVFDFAEGFFAAIEVFSKNNTPQQIIDSNKDYTFALYLGNNKFFALTTRHYSVDQDGGYSHSEFLRWDVRIRDFKESSFSYEEIRAEAEKEAKESATA